MSDEDRAKYLNSPETILFDKSNQLYAMNWSRELIVSNRQAIVVQGYHDRADWLTIARWAARLAVPVFGSGDLRSPEAVLAMLHESGCAGASLARGALGAPWIFRQTMDLAARGTYEPVTTDERRETLVAHFAGLAEQYGEAAALALMPQEGQYYARGMKSARALRVAIQAARDAADFREVVARCLTDEPEPH